MPEDELLEVLDAHGRSILFMPRGTVLRQKLPHRAVLIGLLDQEQKIYIREQRWKGSRKLWDISAAGLVLAGESAEDCARRAMWKTLGIREPALTLLGKIAPSPRTEWRQSIIFVSRPARALINTPPEKNCAGIFVDQDELAALRREMPELLSPNLLLAAVTALIWRDQAI